MSDDEYNKLKGAAYSSLRVKINECSYSVKQLHDEFKQQTDLTSKLLIELIVRLDKLEKDIEACPYR